MNKKYPYIPDKRLYAATMYACKKIRETGWFNKSIQWAADQYGFNFDDVAEQVRKRQSAGQKQSTKPRVYHWYAVEYCLNGERTGSGSYFEQDFAMYLYAKATSAENIMHRMMDEKDDYSEYGSQVYFGRVEEYDTKQEAINRAAEMRYLEGQRRKRERTNGA